MRRILSFQPPLTKKEGQSLCLQGSERHYAPVQMQERQLVKQSVNATTVCHVSRSQLPQTNVLSRLFWVVIAGQRSKTTKFASGALKCHCYVTIKYQSGRLNVAADCLSGSPCAVLQHQYR